MASQSEEQFIEWDHERYSSHIERFDEQHQKLFTLLNDLYVAMEDGRSEEKIGEILRELEAYTEYHFGDEEEFMQDCGFAMDCADCFFNHRKMHDEFAEKVATLREKHENGEYITMEVLMFARDWLDSHIAGLSQDQSYAEYYVDEVPEGYEYEPGQLKKDRRSDEDPHSSSGPTASKRETDSTTAEDESIPERDEPVTASTGPPEDQPVTLGSEIHDGGPLDIPEDSMATWVSRLADEYGDQPAARVESNGAFSAQTFGEMVDRAQELAAGLLADGLSPGERIGIHLGPQYEWSILDLACTLAGLVSVPVSKLYRPARAAHVITDAGIDLLVTDSTPPGPIAEAADTVLDVEQLPTAEAEASSLPGFEADPDDVATIVYRLGTTAHPNGCAITHRNLRGATEMLGTSLSFESGQTGTCFLPLAHMYQRIATYALWNAGTSIAYMDPDSVLETLGVVEPHVLVGVPKLYQRLADQIEARTEEASGLRQKLADGVAESYGEAKDRGSRLSTGFSLKYRVAERTVFSSVRADLGLENVEHALAGTAAIDPELVQFFHGFGLPISEIYGATELSGLAAINSARSYRAGTVGSPVPGVEVALADDDEVLVRGPNVIDGYWDDARSWRGRIRDGWYHTGDLGSFEEDGTLKIRGPK